MGDVAKNYRDLSTAGMTDFPVTKPPMGPMMRSRQAYLWP